MDNDGFGEQVRNLKQFGKAVRCMHTWELKTFGHIPTECGFCDRRLVGVNQVTCLRQAAAS